MANELMRPSRTGQTVVTTDTTKTTIATLETVNDRVYHVVATIVAINDTAATVASYILAATFKNDGGTLSQVGSTSTVHSAESNASLASTIEASGTDILVTGTGLSATNIRWKADVKSHGFDYSGKSDA